MITTYSSRDYRITYQGITLIENALERPDLIQVSVTSDCVILVAPQKEYGIDYEPNGEYRSWKMEGLNTKLARAEAHFIYARLNRRDRNALLLFSVNDYDTDGKINGEGVASADYYYIKIGSITKTDSLENPTLDREITLDFGYLSTPAGGDGSGDSEWRKLFELTTEDLIRPLKNFTSFVVKGTLSIIGKLVLNEKQISDVAREVDEQEFVASDEVIPTTKLLKGKYLDELRKVLLNKDREDYTEFIQTFKKGIKVGEYTTGLLGSGGAILIDQEGNSHAEVDFLNVRKKALFTSITVQELKSIGGALIVSPAAMVISKVEDTGDGYKCYFNRKNTDGKTIYNEFEVDDQGRCQTFNLEKQENGQVGNRYWWRLVTEIGDDYVVFSKTDADTGSDIPAEGDEVSQLGNRTDKTRQNAQIYSAYGPDSPSRKMYQGINSFSLVDKEIKAEFYDITTGRFKEITYGDNFNGARDRTSFFEYIDGEGLKVKGAVDIQPGSVGWKNFTGLSDSIQVAVDAAGNALDKANQAQSDAEDAKQNAEDAKQDAADAANRLDQWASDSVISPTEKLALRQEIANLQSEYDTNITNANKYNLTTTAYTNAWNAYKTELEYHSADTPENITIRPAFKTSQTKFYTERETLLTAIAEAAKEYADKLLESLAVGAENLLLNTGFTGNYKVATLSAATKLSADTSLYSDKLEHWTGTGSVVDDTNSMSGYACQIGSLAQTVVLISGESYVISYKAKGTSVNVSCGGYTGSDSLTSVYKTYTHKFTYQGGGIFMISGNATVCEIKLERGTVRTDWCPSRKDSSPVADEFKHLWYLQDALQGNTQIIGGLTLTTMIQLGQFVEGAMKKVNAGISGIWNDDRDVAYWAGGTFEQAIATIQKVIGGDNPTDAEWKNLAKFVVTHGGDIIIRGYIYALGGIFRGIVYAESGEFNGKITTAKDGKRIELNPETQTFVMFDDNNYKCLELSWQEAIGGINYSALKLNEYDTLGNIIFQTIVSGRLVSMYDKSTNSNILMQPEGFRISGGNKITTINKDNIIINNGTTSRQIFATNEIIGDEATVTNDVLLSTDENGFSKYMRFVGGLFMGTYIK